MTTPNQKVRNHAQSYQVEIIPTWEYLGENWFAFAYHKALQYFASICKSTDLFLPAFEGEDENQKEMQQGLHYRNYTPE